MNVQDVLLGPSTSGNDAVLFRGDPGGADSYLSSSVGTDTVSIRQWYGSAEVVAGGGPGFPTQFFGLKAFFQAAIRDLCLVAEADAPAGMGAVMKLVKGGVGYVVYLVETGDANASPIYLRTTTGTKAIRKKT